MQRLLKILESIEKLERLLKIRRVVGEVQEEEDEVVSEIERLASKYVCTTCWERRREGRERSMRVGRGEGRVEREVCVLGEARGG